MPQPGITNLQPGTVLASNPVLTGPAVPTTQPQQLLLTLACTTTLQSGTVTPPAGTHSLALVWVIAPLSQFSGNASVIGATTGFQYLNIGNETNTSASLTEQLVNVSPYFGAIDGNLTYSFQMLSGTATVYLVAILDTLASYVLPGSQFSTAPNFFTMFGGFQPWQAPNQPPLPFSINMSATGVQHIIAGVAGKSLYLFAISASISAAGAFAGVWQDTNADHLLFETLQNGAPRFYPFYGAELNSTGVTAGLGLDFNVTNAGSSFYQGTIIYSQL